MRTIVYNINMEELLAEAKTQCNVDLTPIISPLAEVQEQINQLSMENKDQVYSYLLNDQTYNKIANALTDLRKIQESDIDCLMTKDHLNAMCPMYSAFSDKINSEDIDHLGDLLDKYDTQIKMTITWFMKSLQYVASNCGSDNQKILKLQKSLNKFTRLINNDSDSDCNCKTNKDSTFLELNSHTVIYVLITVILLLIFAPIAKFAKWI
jgi:hypothetical protein